MSRKLPFIASALSAIALLAAPAVGQAKTMTFGIRLDHEPSNSAPAHNCNEDGNDDVTPPCTRVGIDAGDAVPAGLRAPASGRIVRFRVRAGAPGQMTFRVVRLSGFGRNQVSGDATAIGKGLGTGPTVNVQGNGFSETGNPIESFRANVKVKKGDFVGIDSSSTSALYCSSGGDHQMIFSPKLGGAPRLSTKTDGCELLVQAVMKPSKKK